LPTGAAEVERGKGSTSLPTGAAEVERGKGSTSLRAPTATKRARKPIKTYLLKLLIIHHPLLVKVRLA
jgi:hypothetical protein